MNVHWIKSNKLLIVLVLVTFFLFLLAFIIYKILVKQFDKNEENFIFMKNPRNFIITKELSEGNQDSQVENTKEKLNDYIFQKMGINLGFTGVASGNVNLNKTKGSKSDNERKFVFHEKTVPQFQLSLNPEFQQFSYMNLDLVYDFLMLDSKAIETSESWHAYDNFFTDWGSHILEQVMYGNYLKITYSKVITKKSKETRQDVSVGASAPVTAGLTVGGNVGLGVANSNEDRSFVMDINIYSKGSSRVNKESLHSFISKELVSGKKIDTIMSSNEVSAFAQDQSQDIKDNSYFFKFKSIWDVLIPLKREIVDFQIQAFELEPSQSETLSENFWQRIANLRANYFRNILHCDSQTYPLETNKKIYIQSFEPQIDGNKPVEYQCIQHKTGCVKDDDCIFKSGQCKLQKGKGFIKSQDVFENGGRKTILNVGNDDQYSRQESESCKLTVHGCRCNKDWRGNGSLPRRELWNTKNLNKRH